MIYTTAMLVVILGLVLMAKGSGRKHADMFLIGLVLLIFGGTAAYLVGP